MSAPYEVDLEEQHDLMVEHDDFNAHEEMFINCDCMTRDAPEPTPSPVMKSYAEHIRKELKK